MFAGQLFTRLRKKILVILDRLAEREPAAVPGRPRVFRVDSVEVGGCIAHVIEENHFNSILHGFW